MTRLAATALTEFWDPAAENLLLGPWCAPRGRRECEPFRKRLLPDPWADRTRFEAALDDCERLSERLIGPLTRHLDAALGAKRSDRAWRILVYPWLEYHVQQMYDHHVHLEDAFALAPDLTAETMATSSFRTPADTWEHILWSLDDPYTLQIFSLLLGDRGFPEKAYAWPAPPARRSGLKSSLKRAASWAMARLPRRSGEVVLGDLHLARGHLARVVAGSGLRAVPLWVDLPDAALPPPFLDERRRGLARLIEPRGEFERLCLRSLVHGLPTVFLEGHDAARAHVAARLPRAPRAFLSAVAWHYADALKFAAAECLERGAELWSLQHGGGSYGLLHQAGAERIERAVTDRFYAWGWSSLEGDPKVRDLPSPQLAQVRRSGPGDGLLLVATNLDLRNYRLTRNASNSRALDYLDRQGRLWNALPAELRSRARLRLHWDYGWRHEERLREACPDLRLDDSRVPFPRRLAEARLLLIDCPTTAFQEAFAADAPCLLTWNPADWNFRGYARPFFDRLKEAGLLFDEPEQAAAQAARVYDDPAAWWNEPERRAAREAFTRHFAYRRDDWMDCWLKEINESS